jgi:hypothetical protein
MKRTENMKATMEWLRANGFVASRKETDELLVRNHGLADGAAAGSWVVDGNTSDATCCEILRMIEDGDPAIDLPTLQLGQWAGDPTFGEILDAAGVGGTVDGEYEDDLFYVYSDAWYEGMQNEVERACRARLDG